MTKLMSTFEQFEIVTVPFPFTDSESTKRRPAVVLSDGAHFNDKIGKCIMAMITTAQHSPWPGDVNISNLKQAGLPVQSIIRLKIFTIESSFISKKIGTLSSRDKKSLKSVLDSFLP